MNIRLTEKLETKLDAYRAMRLEETGKRPMRESAVRELLETALTDIEPTRPVADRLRAIEARLDRLEGGHYDE